MRFNLREKIEGIKSKHPNMDPKIRELLDQTADEMERDFEAWEIRQGGVGYAIELDHSATLYYEGRIDDRVIFTTDIGRAFLVRDHAKAVDEAESKIPLSRQALRIRSHEFVPLEKTESAAS